MLELELEFELVMLSEAGMMDELFEDLTSYLYLSASCNALERKPDDLKPECNRDTMAAVFSAQQHTRRH